MALHAPRLPRSAAEVEDPELADEAAWTGLALTGDLVGEAAELLELDSSTATSLQMTGVQLVKPRISDCRFERCELSGIVLEEASLERVEFVDCRLSGAGFSQARIAGARPELVTSDSAFRNVT